MAVNIPLNSYFYNTSFQNAQYPISVACRFKTPNTSGGVQRLQSWNNAGTNIVPCSLIINYPSAGYICCQTYCGVSSSYNITPAISSYSTTNWNSAVAVANTTSTTIFLNGVQGQVLAHANNNAELVLVNYFSVGYMYGYSGQFFSGQIAELGVWTCALDSNDVKALNSGMSPLHIRPSSLIAYYPFGGFFPKNGNSFFKNAYNLTSSGSPTYVDHPNVTFGSNVNILHKTSQATQNIQYGSTTFYINNNIYAPSFLNMYGSLEFIKDSIIHSSYNRIMNGRVDLPNDIIISSSSNKVINGVGIFSGNVDISTTYKRIMNGNSVLSSITKLSDFPSLIINPQLSFQNKNSITGIGNLLINGGTIPLNTSSDLNLTIQRILNPNLIMDTTSTTNNVGSLIMEGYSSLNSNTNISPSTTRIMSSVIDLMNDGRLDNNSYITMNAIQKFINEENLTIIPSLIFNSRVGMENISAFNATPTRIISGNQTIQSKSSIQNICSLIISGMFGADNDSTLDGVLTPVDTGETLLGTSILQTLSHLGLNASLRMEGSADLGNDLNTFLSSNRIILPVVELRNNTSIESNPHSIVNSVVDMEAFGRLSPASQRIINGRFEVGSEGRIIGNSSRIIQGELELNAYTEFLNSSTRIHTGMLVLSNDSSFDSVGNRVISGVMVYDVDSYINSTGQSVLTGQLNLQTSTLLDSSIIKLVFIPFTMNICREYDINLQNSTTNTFQFSINREKEIVLNIRK